MKKRIILIMDVDIKEFEGSRNKDLFEYIDERLKEIKCHMIFSGDLTDKNIDVVNHVINSFKIEGK